VAPSIQAGRGRIVVAGWWKRPEHFHIQTGWLVNHAKFSLRDSADDTTGL
jgi:hypothetical protein